MECAILIASQLLMGGYSSILKSNDGVTTVEIGLKEGKFEDSYLAVLATTDPLTTQIAEAKGYQEQDHLVCSINGKTARVLVQVKLSRHV